MNKKNFIIILGVVQLIPIMALVYFVSDYFILNKTVAYQYDFSATSGKISNLFPLNRVGSISTFEGDAFQAMSIQPVYFRVKTPVTVSTASLEVKFKPQTALRMELGAVRDTNATQVELRPIFDEKLNELAAKSNWSVLTDGGRSLLQKGTNYSSIAQFINQLPDRDIYAIDNISLPIDYQPLNYRPSNKLQQWRLSIVGPHEIWAYVNNEKLDFSFVFGGNDFSGRIMILRDDQIIYEKEIGQSSESVIVADLLPGVYKICLKIPTDQQIISLATKQQKWVFDRAIRFADESPIAKLYTDAGKLFFQAFNNFGVQKVLINGQVLAVSERNKQYQWLNPDLQMSVIDLRAAALKFNASAPIALAAQNYFNPMPQNWREVKETSRFDELQYILTNYRAPGFNNGWYEAKVEFNAEQIYRDELGRMKFLFSFESMNNAEPLVSDIIVRLTVEKNILEKFAEKYLYE